jgi:taurine dioxygenase
MALDIKLLRNIGIEVCGMQVTQPYSDRSKKELYDLWLEHGIMLFRGTGATREDHLRLSRVFGELEVHPVKTMLVKGAPELIRLHDELGLTYVIEGKLRFGFIYWHQDTCFTPGICKGALLHMTVPTPHSEGGTTGWIDTHKAYDALSDSMKARLEGLEVRLSYHSDQSAIRFGMDSMNIRNARPDEARQEDFERPDFPPVVHPLVITHPESGKKSLTISPLNIEYILGIDSAESDQILRSLVAHVMKPEFAYIHDWEPGDMMLWDNRRSIHQAFGWTPGVKRDAFRTTLKGSMMTGRYFETPARL